MLKSIYIYRYIYIYVNLNLTEPAKYVCHIKILLEARKVSELLS